MYKEGDIVEIKSNLIETSSDDIPCGICESMLDYRGKKATIMRVESYLGNISNYQGKVYRLSIDNGKWRWTEPMFFSKNKSKEDLMLLI